MFEDTYSGEEPWNLVEQRNELKRLFKKYPKELSQKGHLKSPKLE
jgi:hypothetical protein